MFLHLSSFLILKLEEISVKVLAENAKAHLVKHEHENLEQEQLRQEEQLISFTQNQLSAENKQQILEFLSENPKGMLTKLDFILLIGIIYWTASTKIAMFGSNVQQQCSDPN